LLNPLHLGGWSSLRGPFSIAWSRNIRPFMLRPLLGSLLFYFTTLVLLVLSDPRPLRGLQPFHLTIVLVSLWKT
jgi:hypothetical protein